MDLLSKSPLFKLALIFGLGIAFAPHLGIYWMVFLASGSLGLIFLLKKKQKLFRRLDETLTLFCIALIMLGLGGFRHEVTRVATVKPNLELYNCREALILGRVVSPIKSSSWGRKATLQVIAIENDGAWHSANGKVLVYIPTSLKSKVDSHDSLVLKGDLRTVYSQYPGYLHHLHSQGVHHSLRVEALQVRGRHRSLISFAEGVQDKFAQKLIRVIHEPELRGIALAMFLGDKRNLSQEQKENFAAAGASHVLAISGLHVGIIFIFLRFLLQPLAWLKQGKRWRSLACLIALLAFMLVTGASPAVVRAVIMLGSVLIFRFFFARYQLLNVLAIAGFIQMVAEPKVIYAIGFQLSYVAVIGILLLLPHFEKSFQAAHKWQKLLYGWIGVSLVATLATAPLVIIYFGQFPTYFLLTNLLISGLMPLLMGWGFATVLLAGVPVLGEFMGMICSHLLSILVFICEAISDLPFAVIRDFSWDEKGIPVLLIQLLLTLAFLTLPRWVLMLKRQQILRLNPKQVA